MNRVDLIALSPLLLLAATSVAVMLAIAFRRDHRLTVLLSLLGLAASFGSLGILSPRVPRQVMFLLIMDHFSHFYIGLIILVTFAIVILSYGYFKKQQEEPEEFYVLLLVAAAGSSVLAASGHFASFFLGLETLTVALYGMISYLQGRRLPVEAGIKYLILAGASSAFILFGMSLVYAEVGTMEFTRIPALRNSMPNLDQAFLLVGTILILTGIGFKLAMVPFHLWAPDVYEGAPAPAGAFIATVSKGAVFSLLLRYLVQSGFDRSGRLIILVNLIAILSMVAGSLLALLQYNLKRILAYFSIAHMGYLLVAFQAGGQRGAEAATFYLTAYFVATLGTFGVVIALSDGDEDADRLEGYSGLFWRRPVQAGILTLMLLSLAGLPLTAGFLGKFYIVAAGASSGIWTLILILVISSVIGLFYYLRVILILYEGPAEPGRIPIDLPPPLSRADGYVLAALTLMLLWIGIYPEPLIRMIRAAAFNLA